MCTVTFELTDTSKKEFVKELLNSFSYIKNIEESDTSDNTIDEKADFLNLAGIWKDYNISEQELRKNAWRIGS